MRRTLFYIPDQIAGWPVFGIGIALTIWLIVSVLALLYTVRRRGWDGEATAQLPMIGLVSAAIIWLLPRIVETVDVGILQVPPVDAARGLPIRGYGMLLLLAVVSGVSLAAHRARRAGLSVDIIISLAFSMVLIGIVGARVFFIVQYWHLLRAPTFAETLGNLLSVDKGGLVVYGSLIGAMISLAYFAIRYRVPLLPLGDLIAPSMALGLALGRLGCLMNGCCFGGQCDHAWAVTFPAGSPPYVDQLGAGKFHGLEFGDQADGVVEVTDVLPGRPAAMSGVSVGQRVMAINGYPVSTAAEARGVMESAASQLELTLVDGSRIVVRAADLPARSLPVHPTQMYSAINAGLLCLLSLALYPYRQKHGQVLAALLTAYAVTRFLLEIIRTDEGGFLATLTISQSVSVAMGIGLLALWFVIQRQPNIESPSA